MKISEKRSQGKSKRFEINIKIMYMLNIRLASGINYCDVIVCSGNFRGCGAGCSDPTANLIKSNVMLAETP